MAITLKICIFDTLLVMPNCVFQLFVYNLQLFENNFQNELTPPKHILALPTWGQKCIFTELQPFEIANFDLGHPVFLQSKRKYLNWFILLLKYILLEKEHEKLVDAFCLCIYSKASVSKEISFESLLCHIWVLLFLMVQFSTKWINEI